MATLGMFGGSAPRRMIRLRPEDQDPMLAQMQIAPMAAPQVPKPRFTAASMMGGTDPAPAPVSEQPAASGGTPPLGMFGSSAPKPSKMEATGQYKPGQRDWWNEISSDPLGFFLTGTEGLSYKRDEAMSYAAAQAAAEERAAREAALRQQAKAAGLDEAGILAMGLNPVEFGKSLGTNYEAANVSGGDSRTFGNGRATFTAPKIGVDGGFGYTQTPEGIEWGDQRGQNYDEVTAEGTLAETGRHNRATEGLDWAKFNHEKTAPKTPEFGDENSLRSQYLGQAKTFQDVARAAGSVRSLSQDMNPAEQMGLIFQTMKMLDPGSTVREGEYANAQNTTGVYGQMWNAYNKAMTGEGLNPTQVKDFRSMIDGLYNAAEGQYAQTYDFYRAQTARYPGMDPSIIQDFRLPKQAPPPGTGAWLKSLSGGGQPQQAPAAQAQAPGDFSGYTTEQLEQMLAQMGER